MKCRTSNKGSIGGGCGILSHVVIVIGCGGCCLVVIPSVGFSMYHPTQDISFPRGWMND